MELLRAMKNPRLRPLAALRPDLPEPLLTGVARALEPESDARLITAEELRASVKATMDVTSGHAELAQLLAKWRGSLKKTVQHRGERDEGAGPASSPSGG